jgi:hypothetical protein
MKKPWVRLLLATLLIFASGLGTGTFATSHFWEQDVHEGLRVRGQLTSVVHLRPTIPQGCATEVQQVAAIERYLEQALQRQVARLFQPAPAIAAARADCLVLALRGPYRNLIGNAGEAYLVDAWQNLVELETMKFHGMGTGATAAAEGDTALQTELTTQYNPDSTRATGSLTEASASVFRTVGTNTVDATAAVTEWGLLSQAATGGGVLWSRVVFSAINVASGDSIQFTYDLTVE